MIPTAYRRKATGVIIVVALLVVGMVWTARHAYNTFELFNGTSHTLQVMWALVFLSLAFHLVLAYTEKTWKTDLKQQAALDSLRVTVNVPCYNEDPESLRRALTALLTQTRMPQVVHVVDDGSTNTDYAEVRREFEAAAILVGVEARWTRIENSGKRHAQLETFREDTDSDIFITMDSDTVADHRCIEEGLKPFANAKVTSVASVILAYNNKHWFVRLTDSWLLAFQLVVRAAMGKLGCVLVNSGNFSLYRAQVIRDAIPSYEAEYFRGNPVMFSDDSLLTLFAHLKGKTVQQPTSFAFTVLPESVSHHLRQQIRWMRGSTIRSIWRFRYLPLNGAAYWEHFAAWVNFALITWAFVYLILLAPFRDAAITPIMFVFSILTCYATAARYLTIGRSDQTFAHQLGTFAMAPVMLAWTAFVLRALRLYSIATCWRTGWGTRDKVEVALEGAMTEAPVDIVDRGKVPAQSQRLAGELDPA